MGVDAYSPTIDSPPHTPKDSTMNTTRTQSLQAVGAAAFLTLAMLLGVNSLAVADPAPAQMAQAAEATA